jgi:hypothetical protein
MDTAREFQEKQWALARLDSEEADTPQREQAVPHIHPCPPPPPER